jgi:NADPH-dependent 2,4-dienoyl-CoA reductase/sulfur reductase-like enzyme
VAGVVVIGAGLAGARTCSALRAAGVREPVVLLGAEPDPPYDRPPLSKDPEAEVDLRDSMGIDVWSAADVRLGVAATGLHGGAYGPGASSTLAVGCSDGTELAASAVVLATGADPVLPQGWSRPGVHVLHTRAQSVSFWGQVHPGSRLAIVGGGWVGCEAAATAARRGARVELFEADSQLLGGRIPEPVSDWVSTWLAELGVRVHTDHPVAAIDEVGGSLVVEGSEVDVVLAALGVRPATAWLDGADVPRSESGAVLVDGWGRSGLPGVFAVGDAAARWSARYSAHLPGGHWTEALNSPEALAPVVAEWVRGPLGGSRWAAAPESAPVDPIPYVFSDLGGTMLLVLGDAASGRVVWRISPDTDPGSDAWTAFSVDDSDRLLGMSTVGRPRDVAVARRAMLADPRGAPRTNLEALRDPTAAPAAMFPGEG